MSDHQSTSGDALDLNCLVIRTPCTRNLNVLTGDQRKRFCEHCQKNVYNLSNLTRQEIIDLIEGSGEKICGRLYRRQDGTIVTADCADAGVIARREATRRERPPRFRFAIAHLLALMAFCAAAFAAIPWVGRKIEPLVHRWLKPDPPAPAAPVILDDYWEGEMEMLVPEEPEVPKTEQM